MDSVTRQVFSGKRGHITADVDGLYLHVKDELEQHYPGNHELDSLKELWRMAKLYELTEESSDADPRG